MKITAFAENIAAVEMGKKQVDIAQIKEILAIINNATNGLFYALIRWMPE